MAEHPFWRYVDRMRASFDEDTKAERPEDEETAVIAHLEDGSQVEINTVVTSGDWEWIGFEETSNPDATKHRVVFVRDSVVRQVEIKNVARGNLPKKAYGFELRDAG